MSKILKVAATVVGVVALTVMTAGAATFGIGLAAAASSVGIAGITASTMFLVSAGLSVASGLLAKRPKAPATSDSAKDRLQVSIDPRTPRKFVFGRTAMATDLRDQEIIGSNQDYVDRFIVVASHAVQSIEEIWFDDKLAWSAGGGVGSDFAGYLTVTPVLEGLAANAINISPRMGSTRRYTGLAYVYFRYKMTGNTKKATSPFQQSIPSRVTIVGRGAKVYDPRLDSTVPGGSGPQRANDQSTWSWSDSASRNPAIQLLWYLLGWRINGRLAVGKGIPPARINLESFITAANLCDEAVTLAAGGTEPRYRSDGVFSEGDATGTVLDQLKAAMNAELDDVDGRLRLLVLHNDLATPIADLSEDDILDDFTWDQTTSLDDTFNVVRGTYIDPSSTSLYQAVDYPEVRIASPDGIDRIETVDLQLVQSPSQAQRLAKQRVARMLYSGMFTAVFGHRAWKVQRGDVVRLSFAPLGWTNKLFRVVDTAVQVDGQVPMTLREEHPDIYLWDREEAPAVAAVVPTSYDPAKDPLYTFILDNSGLTAWLTNESHTLPADSAGNVTSYAGAGGELKVFSGGTDISSTFVLSTAPGGNPQGLAVSYAGQTYSVTGGLDAAEPNATLTIRATAAGGLIVDKTFSLSKSKAGANGASPPLIALEASSQIARFDKSGSYVGGPITFRATKQNASARTAFTIYRVSDGFALAGPAYVESFVSSMPAYFSYATLDDLTMNAAGVAAFINSYGPFSVRAHIDGTSIGDTVTVSLAGDGADGAKGADGKSSIIQGSADGASWHFGLQAGDVYMRVSNDSGATFGPAVVIKGEAGLNGNTDYDSFVFKISATQPARPADNSGDPPPGWTDAPTSTSGAQIEWWSTARFRAGVGQLSSWSDPARVTGQAGQDGMSFSLSVSAVDVAADYLGNAKPGQFPITFSCKLASGGTDVSGAATFTVPDKGGNDAAKASALVVAINSVTADGYVDVRCQYGSFDQTIRLPVTLKKDQAPAQQGLAQQTTNDLGSFAKATTAYPASPNYIMTIRADASGRINFAYGFSYKCPAPSVLGSRSARAAAKAVYRVAGSGGAWIDATAEVVGYPAIGRRYEIAPGEQETSTTDGSCSDNQTRTGLTAGGDYEVGLLIRNWGTDGDPATYQCFGSFTAKQP